MLCNEFDARLQNLLDERKSPELDAHLVSHAQRCASCHQQLTTVVALFDSLDCLEVPSLGPDFAQRVVDSVVDARPVSPARRSPATWLLAAAAIAALLLISTVPLLWNSGGSHDGIAQPTVNRSPNAGADPAESIDFTPDSDGWLVSASLLEFYSEETRQRHRNHVNQIADDLRPIATPFNAAVTAIRRSIPVGKTESKGEPRASIHRKSMSGQIS